MPAAHTPAGVITVELWTDQIDSQSFAFNIKEPDMFRAECQNGITAQ